jgi:threonine/homoserine/homoserine lactone efflux protein
MIAIPIGFLMGFLGSMPIAGPISSLVFHRGMDGRFWEGWAIGLGGALAEGIYCALAVYGLGALYDRFPVFTTLTQGIRILLPLILGLFFLLTKRASVQDPMPVLDTRRQMGSFVAGFCVAAVNPFLYLTWSASLAMLYSLTGLTFHGPTRIAFLGGVVGGIVAWLSLLLVLLRRFRQRFPFSLHVALIRAVGVALIGLSLVSLIMPS